jgi:hypothetical protein
VFNGVRSKVVVRFVDIVGTVDHQFGVSFHK